ncbi:MAG: hypothetical protein K0S63_1278 [Gammaproteobacteria bacterium]|nr:hypothetical protein [Gammaproteobacteria bacterium]
MRNKIAICLGLALSLNTAMVFADSNPTGKTMTIKLSDSDYVTLSTAKNYQQHYSLTCNLSTTAPKMQVRVQQQYGFFGYAIVTDENGKGISGQSGLFTGKIDASKATIVIHDIVRTSGDYMFLNSSPFSKDKIEFFNDGQKNQGYDTIAVKCEPLVETN